MFASINVACLGNITFMYDKDMPLKSFVCIEIHKYLKKKYQKSIHTNVTLSKETSVWQNLTFNSLCIIPTYHNTTGEWHV